MFVAPQTIQQGLIRRVGKKDKTAVNECIAAYGNFVWAMARKFTATPEEAEVATEEIFADIWRYASRTDIVMTPDDQIISLIARRRLFKYLL